MNRSVLDSYKTTADNAIAAIHRRNLEQHHYDPTNGWIIINDPTVPAEIKTAAPVNTIIFEMFRADFEDSFCVG